jgi:hypothetical protein
MHAARPCRSASIPVSRRRDSATASPIPTLTCDACQAWSACPPLGAPVREWRTASDTTVFPVGVSLGGNRARNAAVSGGASHPESCSCSAYRVSDQAQHPILKSSPWWTRSEQPFRTIETAALRARVLGRQEPVSHSRQIPSPASPDHPEGASTATSSITARIYAAWTAGRFTCFRN